MNKTTVEECQKISISQIAKSRFSLSSKITINNQEINLSFTKCHYGGRRKWFLCPRCNRRAGVLYRKPLQSVFLCRTCQDLTYELTCYRRSTDENTYKILHRVNVGSIEKGGVL